MFSGPHLLPLHSVISYDVPGPRLASSSSIRTTDIPGVQHVQDDTLHNANDGANMDQAQSLFLKNW